MAGSARVSDSDLLATRSDGSRLYLITRDPRRGPLGRIELADGRQGPVLTLAAIMARARPREWRLTGAGKNLSWRRSST